MATTRMPRPVWFVILAAILLLWGAMGCFACIQQIRLGAQGWGGTTAYDRHLYAALPGWYDVCYAIGVGTGFLGTLALLLRSALARPLYIVSLFAVGVQFGYLFAATDIIAVKGAATVVPFPVLIALIALFEIWLAGLARRRGWIG